MATIGLVQQAVWRQAGRCLVGHFAGFWEFASRPSLCETPPAAKPQLPAMHGRQHSVGRAKLDDKTGMLKTN